MKCPATVHSFEQASEFAEPLCLAIGMFDGVHLGHLAVIESAIASAVDCGGIAGVLTFDPHPSRLFCPDDPTRLLLSVDKKCQRLRRAGVNLVIIKHFDADFAAIGAADFAGQLKSALPALRSVYVGENFRFGQYRAGDVSTLAETGREAGLDVISVARVQQNGQPISSTRIREELSNGAIALVNDLLGYNYFSDGIVLDGNKLGRKIGFPTMNLLWEPDCLPCFGVYFVRFRSDKGDWIPAIANYGIRPTVAADGPPLLEVHALRGSGFEAGHKLEVEWLHFLRREQKFDSVEALKGQISLDVKAALDFAEHV